MLQQAIRSLAFVAGGLIFFGGVVAIAAGGPAAPSGIWAVGIGAAFMIAALLQRPRYRSEAAERSHATPGPGGGEEGYLEPRFMPTTEVFRDPTSGRLMRVYEDPHSGERRYRAEAW